MEEAVFDPVTAALAEASQPGEEYKPEKLIAVVSAGLDSALALNDEDRIGARFAAIQEDLGFLVRWSHTKMPLTEEERRRIAGLMRWLMREFNEWQPKSDTEDRRLAALLVVTRFCNLQGNFWSGFIAHQGNPALVARLGDWIADQPVAFGVSPFSDSPYSDTDLINEFNTADAAGDLSAVVSHWPRIGHNVQPIGAFSEAVQYLDAFARDKLVRILERLQGTPKVMWVLVPLPLRECLVLALETANPSVQFGAMLRLMGDRRRKPGELDAGEVALLTRLFLAVASDEGRWKQWMMALNRHPLNHHRIQTALGNALISAPDTALSAYLDAINLSTSGSSRQVVADCLRTFRMGAPLGRRRLLWKLAYERWMEWDFGKAEELVQLTDIAHCELDYAIVAYAVECMSAEECVDRLKALELDLSGLPNQWHESLTVYCQAVNRILSWMQPYATAGRLGPADEWLVETEYIPSALIGNTYESSLWMTHALQLTRRLS